MVDVGGPRLGAADVVVVPVLVPPPELVPVWSHEEPMSGGGPQLGVVVVLDPGVGAGADGAEGGVGRPGAPPLPPLEPD